MHDAAGPNGTADDFSAEGRSETGSLKRRHFVT